MLNSIDAVFTWVDGEDPEHQKKRQEFSADVNLPGTQKHAASATRFSDQGELFFAVLLARKNAPWLRHIYIVTDAQVPAWLTLDLAKQLDVHVIDHKILFRGYEEYLPVFSSRAIEAMIHRIPGLSSKFVYLNDDVFIVRPVTEEQYFFKGKSFFRGKWRWNIRLLKKGKKIVRRVSRNKVKPRPDGLVGKRAEVDMMGLWRYFALAHVPHPIVKKHYKSLLTEDVIKNILRFRFRNEKQIWPIGYYVNHLIREGGGRLFYDGWNYITPEFPDLLVEDNTSILTQAEPHLCIQSMDEIPLDIRKNLIKQLEALSKT